MSLSLACSRSSTEGSKANKGMTVWKLGRTLSVNEQANKGVTKCES